MTDLPLRVTLITGSWPPDPCGVGDYTARLAEALRGAGVEVSVVGVRSPASPPSWSVRAVPALVRHILGTRPDVVHVQYPTVGYRRGLAPNLLPWTLKVAAPRVPVVTTVHEFGTFRLPGRLRVALGALGSTAVVVPDPANLAALARFAPPLRGRLHEIPVAPSILPAGPLPAGRRAAIRARFGVADGECLAVYFGFVTRSKGIDTLLRAAGLARRRLLESGAPSIRLALLAAPAANDPAEAAVVESVAAIWREEGGETLAAWTGNLADADVSDHLAAADFAVLPFRDGASPRRTTLLAALAHDLPVVTTTPPPGVPTPPGGTGETTGTGFPPDALALVPPDDPAALAEAMVALARSPERRSWLAAGARRAAKGFRWPAIAARHAALYRRLAGRGG